MSPKEKNKNHRGSKPEISIIMPVYNTEKYVAEAIDSALNQTFENFEFIIIDDWSTDSSRNIIQKYVQQDKRIKAFQNVKNKGVSQTLNKAIQKSNTNYLVRMDADDIMHPQRIEKQYQYMIENPTVGIISTDIYIMNEKWDKIWTRKYNKNISKIIFNESPICHPATLYKKDIILKLGWYNSQYDAAEDYELWLRAYMHKINFHILPDFLLSYRVYKDSSQKNIVKKKLEKTIHLKKYIFKKYKKHKEIRMVNHIRLYGEILLKYTLKPKTILYLFNIYKWIK